MKRIFLTLLFICPSLFAQTTFPHFKAFQNKLTELSNNPTGMDAFFTELATAKKIPFAMGDSVAFLYRGSATSVGFAGDFNSWSPTAAAKIGTTTVWQWIQKYPATTRVDYKIVLNGNNWILDPNNQNQQVSGLAGVINSELRMPAWVFPQETLRASGIPQGSLSANQFINSTNLAYQVQYKVYTPPNYANLSALPVIYVTDGHEYATDVLGAMLPITDNLINGFNGRKIKPIIIVFIDPRNPSDLSNRRMQEYTTNAKYADFVANELVPVIDLAYKTNKNAASRMILGTSLGGLVSAYIGYKHSATFEKIAPMSPAFQQATSIFSLYENSPKLPLKFFMTTGTINDTQARALQMKGILDTKGYPLQYTEVSDGHSWGNWRALIDDIFVAAFPFSTVATETEIPSKLQLFQAYPNPFSDSLTVKIELQGAQKSDLILYDVLGKERLIILKNNDLNAGIHQIQVAIDTLPKGTYLLRFNQESAITVVKH